MASYYKRGNSFVIRVSCGYNAEGKQVYQSMTWKPEAGMTEKQIEKEVNRQAVLFEENCKKGYQCKVVKFEQFCEEWFAEYAKPNLRTTTYNSLYHRRLRIYEAIGHLRMDKITARQIQLFINSLSKDGVNERNGKPLSPKSIKHNLSLISDVFSYAVKMGIVADNPCSRVTLPKIEQKEKKIYTPEEASKFLDLLNKEPIKYRAFFNLAIYSGFRRGELLGLEWKDIDWENNLISVRRTSNYTAERGTYTDTTKTKKSKRTLKFPDYVMNMLRELKEEQDKEQNELGNKWTYTDRLFTQWDGKPMGNNSPYYWVKRFCKRNNLRFCDLHSLRHLHASLLINAGVDVVAVSGDMGHSCVGTTSNIYCHMFQEARAKNSEVIAAVLNFDAR